MTALVIGIAAFILFGLYDFNQVLWKNPGLRSGFLLGMLALGLATFFMIRDILPGMDFGGSSLAGIGSGPSLFWNADVCIVPSTALP